MCFPNFSCIIENVQLNGLLKGVWLIPDRKGVMLMSTFQAISLMLLFGMFILALLTYINKK
ncbi:putative holin-like toxin [Bacillus altitudinis]|uniref:putative holin-like toxin n=1 Tax=Bacillus altitudinis TaxID=293387 RepID=UPI003F299A0E